MLSLSLQTTLHKKNSVHCCLRSKPYAMLFDRLQTTQHCKISCAMLSEHHLVIFCNFYSGARKSVLLKASSRERYTHQNFVHLATFRGARVHLIVYLVVHQMKYLIGKMNQYNKILQFPHVKARRLSKKKKPRLCFTR